MDGQNTYTSKTTHTHRGKIQPSTPSKLASQFSPSPEIRRPCHLWRSGRRCLPATSPSLAHGHHYLSLGLNLDLRTDARNRISVFVHSTLSNTPHLRMATAAERGTPSSSMSSMGLRCKTSRAVRIPLDWSSPITPAPSSRPQRSR